MGTVTQLDKKLYLLTYSTCKALRIRLHSYTFTLLSAFTKLRQATISVISVRPSAWNNPALTIRIFMDFYTWAFLRICMEKIQVSLKSDKNNRVLYLTTQRRFMICRWIILGMRNVSDKRCRENQNTHLSVREYFSENRAVYEIMWKMYSRTGHK
jgi:hypothetical protein